MEAGDPCFPWEGRDLDIRGDATQQLAQLSALIADRWATAQPHLNAAEILDLSRYSARIVGFDVYRPVYSPYIQKTEKGGSWLPETIQPIIACHPPGVDAPVHFTVEKEQLDELALKVDVAREKGAATVAMDAWPGPVSVADAQAILEAYQPLLKPRPGAPFDGMAEEMAAFEYESPPAQKPPTTPSVQLLIGENIEKPDYAEERGQLLAFNKNSTPMLPCTLADHVVLLPHQRVGVAWLQHLW